MCARLCLELCVLLSVFTPVDENTVPIVNFSYHGVDFILG